LLTVSYFPIVHNEHALLAANSNLKASKTNFEMPTRSPDNAGPSRDCIIEAYIGHLQAADPNFKEMVVREMVRNFRRKIRPDDDDDDDDDEETIYDELAEAFLFSVILAHIMRRYTFHIAIQLVLLRDPPKNLDQQWPPTRHAAQTPSTTISSAVPSLSFKQG
jgi:hypothetical protein